MASSKIPFDGCINTSFTLGSGVTQWTVNKVKIDPKRKIAHFWLSYYGKMTSGQVVATLPSGYYSSNHVRFQASALQINTTTELYFHHISNGTDIIVESTALDGNTTRYITLTGEIPLV